MSVRAANSAPNKATFASAGDPACTGPGGASKNPGLRRPRRRGFCPGQLQQPAQPRVCRPQLRELPGHHCCRLAARESLAHADHRKALAAQDQTAY
jgi:hypothetical protein